jgi:hypothetical protein
MITAGRNECRLGTEFLLQLKAQNVPIELQRPLQIGHLQMHMANPDLRINAMRIGFLAVTHTR